MRAQRERLRDGETGLLAVFDHHLGGRQAAAGKYLGDDELDETRRLEAQLLTAGRHLVGVVADAALTVIRPSAGMMLKHRLKKSS